MKPSDWNTPMRTYRRYSGNIRTLLLIVTLFMLPVSAVRADSVYKYDALGRLIRVDLDNGMSLGYTFDASGNWSAKYADFVPGVPTIQAAFPGNQRVVIHFAPPVSGGVGIDNYTATCAPAAGGSTISATATDSPIVFTGLSNGVLYSCSLHANNAVGSGAETSAVVRKVGMNILIPLFFLLLE